MVYNDPEFTADLMFLFEPLLNKVCVKEILTPGDLHRALSSLDEAVERLEPLLATHRTIKDEMIRQADARERDLYISNRTGSQKLREKEAKREAFDPEWRELMAVNSARLEYLWSVKNRTDWKREAIRMIARNIGR